MHLRVVLPRFPQGQGLLATIKMNFDGKTIVPAARETDTKPSSKGCRKASKVARSNSGNSSKNKTPRWASDISPGVGCDPPPTSPIREVV